MSPFQALYGYPPPKFSWNVSKEVRVSTVEDLLKEQENLSKLPVDQLEKAQHKMKFYADKNKTKREFQVRDIMYLKLQPYKQASLRLRKNLKLSSKYYGPYLIVVKIGKVAYKLQLLEFSKLHPVFHVNLLKKKVGTKDVPSLTLLKVGKNGQPLVYPAVVLDKRMVKKNNKAVTQLLVEWSNLGSENAIWEDFSVLKSQIPLFDPYGQ
ncbi:uncharacterized protein LOC111274324 [Durio zibethinus]|uniref:Uncharacterized protein LOC111274324 n=1 Tax=Durio zibethinus TaxID=66656 RepID=A0A6P5WFI0_DURZI|nr:uncharacterized protein LOC111274324 [Durio zibethinus]